MAKEIVARVISGDTFETESERRILLADVDAPDPFSPGAKIAAEELGTLLQPGQAVSLRVTQMGLGRYVAKVMAEGTDVNAKMRAFIRKMPKRQRERKFIFRPARRQNISRR